MTYKSVNVDLEDIEKDWKLVENKTQRCPIFSTYDWCNIWWRYFHNDYRINIVTISSSTMHIGIAPIMLKDNTAYLIGSPDICDFLDFIVHPNYETAFFRTLLNHLYSNGIQRLDLFPLRQDSTAMTELLRLCQHSGLSLTVNEIDVSPYIDLPSSWNDYLLMLDKKQKHELKRKLRRLNEHGEVLFNVVSNAQQTELDLFFSLFRNSRNEKAAFLTPKMELFLRDIFTSMAAKDVFRLCKLYLNQKCVAATVVFDYNNKWLLYNSGFDREYSWLSVGLISKALSIKEAIENKKKNFDFLKGNENYKYHLGGVDAPIYRCTILLTNKI